MALVALNVVVWAVWAIFDRTTQDSLPWPAWISLVTVVVLAIRPLNLPPWPLRRQSDSEMYREQRRVQPR